MTRVIITLLKHCLMHQCFQTALLGNHASLLEPSTKMRFMVWGLVICSCRANPAMSLSIWLQGHTQNQHAEMQHLTLAKASQQISAVTLDVNSISKYVYVVWKLTVHQHDSSATLAHTTTAAGCPRSSGWRPTNGPHLGAWRCSKTAWPRAPTIQPGFQRSCKSKHLAVVHTVWIFGSTRWAQAHQHFQHKLIMTQVSHLFQVPCAELVLSLLD